MFIEPVKISKLRNRYNVPIHLRCKETYEINNFRKLFYYSKENITNKELYITADCVHLSFNFYFHSREEGENLVNKLRNNEFPFDEMTIDTPFETKIKKEFQKYFIDLRQNVELIIEHHTYKDDEHLNKLKKLQKNNKRKLKYLCVTEQMDFPYEVEISHKNYNEIQGFRKDCIETLNGNLGEKGIDYILQKSDEKSIRYCSIGNLSNRTFKFYTNSMENVNIAVMLFGDFNYKITKYITNENEVE